MTTEISITSPKNLTSLPAVARKIILLSDSGGFSFLAAHLNQLPTISLGYHVENPDTDYYRSIYRLSFSCHICSEKSLDTQQHSCHYLEDIPGALLPVPMRICTDKTLAVYV